MEEKTDQFKLKKGTTIFIFSLFIVVFLIGCKPINVKIAIPSPDPIILGYCPTMKPNIQSLVESNLNLDAVQFENSSRAIQALNSGTIHAALIGRTAWRNEVGEDISLVRIEDGYTLITQTQEAIPYEALPLIKIYTLEANKDASAILPPGTSITFYQDFDQMMAELDVSSAVLLRWSELPTTYQLLIPVDGQGNKKPEYRSPHFYYDSSLDIDFSKVIEALSAEEVCPLDLECAD